MKYTININQFCWYANKLTNLDIVDLAVFDAIRGFVLSDNAETISVNHQIYYWVSPRLLINELPILGITTERNINRRIDNLIDAKLLERCPSNQSVKRTYIRMGENYNKYICYDGTQMSELGQICPTPTWTQMSNNNNTIIDEETNHIKEKIQKEKSLALSFPFHSETFMEWWNKVRTLKKWKAKTESQLQFSLDKLAKINEQEAIQCLKDTFENGWQGVFIDKYLKNKPQPTKPQRHIWDEMGVTEEYYRTQILGK